MSDNGKRCCRLGSNKKEDPREYKVTSPVYGVRDAKMNLSRLLREVKSGKEVIITEYGRPIARVVPAKELTLLEHITEMEMRGEIESSISRIPDKIVPLPIAKGIPQKYLQQDRE